jgi:hypothetical protein
MLEVKPLIAAFRYPDMREILSARQIPKESCGQLRNRWTLGAWLSVEAWNETGDTSSVKYSSGIANPASTGVEGNGWEAAGLEFGSAPLRIAS